MLKFLLLIAMIAAVWYGWRYVNRKSLGRPSGESPPAPPPPAAPPPKPVAEDLKPCSVCGAYVAAESAKSCGRPGCPHPQV
jgi:hypothetical protein